LSIEGAVSLRNSRAESARNSTSAAFNVFAGHQPQVSLLPLNLASIERPFDLPGFDMAASAAPLLHTPQHETGCD
jgi:hypothetical protein